ncbi:MAG: hypothetical protein AAFV33_16935, partial [Chloroflexota bacterium]
HNLNTIKEAFGEAVWDPVPLRTMISEATNFRQALYAYAPTSREAQMMWKLTNKFEKAVVEWVG